MARRFAAAIGHFDSSLVSLCDDRFQQTGCLTHCSLLTSLPPVQATDPKTWARGALVHTCHQGVVGQFPWVMTGNMRAGFDMGAVHCAGTAAFTVRSGKQFVERVISLPAAEFDPLRVKFATE